MLVKTSTLTDLALDWAVAIAKGIPAEEICISGAGKYRTLFRYLRDEDGNLNGTYMTGPDLLFSTKWEAGGPLIEREAIAVRKYGDFPESMWQADNWAFRFAEVKATGPTPLIAAMRCYCCSKLGDEVEIPDALTPTEPVITLNRQAVWPFR